MAASSENDAVNAVLREYVDHANRLQDEERLAAMWPGFSRSF
jgi:hypothetical protein